jgi:hypothetical protein
MLEKQETEKYLQAVAFQVFPSPYQKPASSFVRQELG